MHTTGLGIDNESCEPPPQYSSIATAIPPYSEFPFWTVPLDFPSNQQEDDPPPPYQILDDLPGYQLHFTPSIPHRPKPAESFNVFSNVPTWVDPPTERELCSNHNAEQRNTSQTAYANNVHSSTPTRNPFVITNSEDHRQERTPSILKQMYRKWRPRTFGISLMLITLVQFGMGIALIVNVPIDGSRTITSGITFWASLFHLFTGVWSFPAHSKPTYCKVKTAVFLNAVSVIFSCVGVALNVLDVKQPCSLTSLCDLTFGSPYSLYYIHIALNTLTMITALSAVCGGCRALISSFGR
ncbi:uncharacterized protein [Hyperolius riggenbachi]|uniref:uncharacterized protein n=1 Tax=Hyperolius riggenbachi TaxID=752182 RepID=UPI0035A2AAE2